MLLPPTPPSRPRPRLLHSRSTARHPPSPPVAPKTGRTEAQPRSPSMKLYYAPGACSIGIHVLLEELGKPYESEAVNLREGAQYKSEFTAINPKSKVPTLVRDDGSVLTEYPAIAYWLARTNPFGNLLPDDIDLQTQALSLTDYAVATI